MSDSADNFATIREATIAIAATVRDHAIVLLDRTGQIKTWNPGAIQVTGFSAEEVIGRHFSSFYLDEDVRAGVPEQILERAYREDRVEVSGWRLRKGGTRFWAEVAITALFDRREALVGFSCVTRDITERMLGDDLFREAMRHSPVGTVLTSTDGIVLAVNAAVTEIMGYSADELIGMDIETLIHPDDRPVSSANWIEVKTGRSPTRQFEKRYRRKDGTTIFASLTLVAIKNDRDETIYSIRYIQDISKRMAVEAERVRLAERMTLAAEAAGIGIWEWNIETGRTEWDDRILALYGTERNSIEAIDNDFWIRWTHADDRDRMYQAFWRAIENQMPFDEEFRVVWPDASVRYLRGSAKFVRNEAGVVTRIVGIHWDITESRVAEAARTRLLERLTLAIEAGQFGVWEVDLETGERFWDRRTKELYGLDPDQPSPDYQVWLPIIHPEDTERVRDAVTTLTAAKSRQTTDFRVVWPNGEVRHIRSLATVVQDEPGAARRAIGINADVTEAAVAEAERARLTDRMELALDAAKMGIWEIDLHTGAVEWDERMPELFAFDRQAGIPTFEEWLLRVHPDDQDRIRSALTETVQGRFFGTQEYQIVLPDGTIRHIRSEQTAVRDSSGNPVRLVGLSMDITDRKSAEQELARATERVTLALRAGQLGVWEINVKTGDVLWDKAMLRQYGFDPAAPGLTSDWTTLIHPDDRDRILQTLADISAGSGPMEAELRIVLPDGAVRDLRTVVAVVRAESGAPLRIIGINQDITRRKAAEAELARLTERMTLALRAGDLGVWEINIRTGERFSDETTMRHYGIDPENPIPSQEWLDRCVHPEDRNILGEAISRTLNSPTPTEAEFRSVWSDGTVHRLRNLATAVRDGEGSPARIVGICQDVTAARTMALELEEERQRLVQTVEQWMLAKQAAENANRAKSDFLTVMSHELRTPMNAVLGFGQLLADPRFGPLNTKQTEFVQTILQSGGHLLGLIDEILELSRIESGKMEISIVPVEIATVMKSVIATLTPAAEKHAIRLNPGNLGIGSPAVRADRVRLAQALLNLGSNAIKYNRPNGEVTFTYEQVDGGWLRITVIDTGIGIPKNRQDELFQPFNRLGAAHLAIEGTGVGLALTRRLVDLMGGRVDFSSILGQGSRFWIDLPIDLGPQ